MKAYVTVGVSASGKSTWAKEFIDNKNCSRNSENQETWVHVERDKIRRNIQLSNGVSVGSSGVNWKKWNWKKESAVTEIFWSEIFSAAERGFNIIISDTNLNVHRRNDMVEKLQKMGYEVEVKEFQVTWEEACARDTARENGVGYSVLASQFSQWNAEHIKQYSGTVGKNKTVICDIDGTIAHMSGRSPFEWQKVDQDKVDSVVREMVLNYFDSNYDIVFLSGRDGSCRTLTEEWLNKHVGVKMYTLFMREEGDQRRDDIVKEELFWKYVADNYDVQFVIDDRPQMCRKWRAMGIKTFQVADPYKEF